MSRNGSGTYSVVNTFTAGTTITAAGHNQNWSDIASEITNSVAVDGQSTMTGPLKAANGTVAAPGITFGSDTDSGLYRIGANNIGVAVNGAKVGDFATTGFSVTGTFTSSGALTVTSGGLTVTAGGATVTAGGLTVTAGGITLTAGVHTAPVGAVGAPSYTFAGDTDSGIYRIGTDNLGVAVAGAKVLDISATGLAVTGAVTGTTVTATNVAAQADQETASSNVLFVSPGRQQYHPSAAKAWVKFTSTGSNGVQTIDASFNVSGVSRNSAGNYTVTFTTAFSSAHYAVNITSTNAPVSYVLTGGQLAGSLNILFNNSSFVAADPTSGFIVCFGDL